MPVTILPLPTLQHLFLYKLGFQNLRAGKEKGSADLKTNKQTNKTTLQPLLAAYSSKMCWWEPKPYQSMPSLPHIRLSTPSPSPGPPPNYKIAEKGQLEHAPSAAQQHGKERELPMKEPRPPGGHKGDPPQDWARKALLGADLCLHSHLLLWRMASSVSPPS